MFWKRVTDLFLAVAIVLIFSLVFIPTRNAHSIHLETEVQEAPDETLPEPETTVPTVPDEIHIRKENHIDEAFQNNAVIPLYINIYRGPQSGDFSWTAINGYSVYEPETILETPEALNAEFLAMVMPGEGIGAPAGMAQTADQQTNASIRVVRSYPGQKSQKSYEIVMDAGCALWGNHRVISLHKFENDGLRMRARLVDWLLEDVPQLVAPHTQFVQLYVRNITSGDPGNYTNYGLYTMVEHLDDKTIQNHGLDGQGELYKLNNFDFGRYDTVVLETSAPSYNKAAMDVYIENRTGSNNQKLITMLDAINNAEMTSEEILNTYFDRENLLYWMAFQILTGNVDSRTGNSYLYSPPGSQKWFLLADEFSSSLHRFEYENTGWSGQKEWESGISNYWPNSLFQRFLKNKQFRADLSDTIAYLAGTVLTRENLYSKAEPLKQIALRYLNAAPDSALQIYSGWMYPQYYDRLGEEILLNQTLYESSLHKPMPFYIKGLLVDQGELILDWEPAFALDGSDVTYTVELCPESQPYRSIETRTNLRLPSARLALPGIGTYYVRITAENSSGMKQTALDIVYTQQGSVYGAKAFQVNASGEVIELIS